jgi:cell division septal protein FtsQ
LALVVLVGVLAWVGWVWYQGSSFVRVRHVTVTGLSGPEVSQIRAALTDTALGMTTMNVQVTKLERAVQSFPYVESITVVSRGAHAVTIEVTEQVPVALVEVGGEAQVVDGRDQILTDSTIPHGLLPRVPLRSPPTGGTVTAAGARAAVATLAAAPYALLAHIQSATWNADHGVVAQLRGGPQIYFGSDDELARKWQAAVAVLQNSDSAGAGYIDVTDPQRPAAGVSVSAQDAQSLGLVTDASAAGQSSSPGSTASTATAASGTAATTGASPASTSPAVGP